MPWSPAPCESASASASACCSSYEESTPRRMSGDCSSSATITPQVAASKPRSELVEPMSATTSLTMRGMSTYASVVISPATITRPVVHSTSQATRPRGSCSSTASSTASEIWSATLSGWPSVTDSDVNRCSLIGGQVTSTLRRHRPLGRRLLLRLLARHQRGQRVVRGEPAPGHVTDGGGDRELEAAVGGEVAERPCGGEALDHLAHLLLDPLHGHALGEQLAGPPVSRVAGDAGGHQVAHPREAAVRPRL